MRSKFEKLPSIEKALAEHPEVHYYEPDDVYRYVGFDAADTLAAVYIQGAWYAFKEQKKQLDLMNQYTAAQGESIKILNDERIKQQKKIDAVLQKIAEQQADYGQPAWIYLEEIKELLK